MLGTGEGLVTKETMILLLIPAEWMVQSWCPEGELSKNRRSRREVFLSFPNPEKDQRNLVARVLDMTGSHQINCDQHNFKFQTSKNGGLCWPKFDTNKEQDKNLVTYSEFGGEPTVHKVKMWYGKDAKIQCVAPGRKMYPGFWLQSSCSQCFCRTRTLLITGEMSAQSQGWLKFWNNKIN